MSPQLRHGLKTAAEFAGCTLNAFAVQVLATAVGDPSRFRAQTAPDGTALPDVERDARGYPLDWRERAAHIDARSHFIAEMDTQTEMSKDEWYARIKKYDAEDPGYFIEWWRLRSS